jgi:tRNA(Arg) A34 adenosine deaminase TadA
MLILVILNIYVMIKSCTLGIRKVYFGCGNDKFGGNGSVFDVNQEYVSFFPTLASVFIDVCADRN